MLCHTLITNVRNNEASALRLHSLFVDEADWVVIVRRLDKRNQYIDKGPTGAIWVSKPKAHVINTNKTEIRTSLTFLPLCLLAVWYNSKCLYPGSFLPQPNDLFRPCHQRISKSWPVKCFCFTSFESYIRLPPISPLQQLEYIRLRIFLSPSDILFKERFAFFD